MSFRLEGDLKANLAGMEAKQRAAIVAAANYTAPQIESYMKTNASWTDRTGNARNGLRARVQVGTNTVAIIMHHSVDYGIWLEVRWGGRYAIIMPSLQYGAPLFAQNIGKLLFK